MAPKLKKALNAWEYPNKSGIQIREILNSHAGEAFNGAYLVTIPAKLTRKLRLRKQFKTRKEAEKYADDALTGAREQGAGFFAVTDREKLELAASMPALRGQGVSVDEAIRFALKHLQPTGRAKTLQVVVDELVASKATRYEGGHLRERSYKDFKLRAKKIADGFSGRIVSEISCEEIIAWVTALDLGPRSNRNYLSTLGEVLKYARQKRYISFSPLDELIDEDRKRICGEGLPEKEPSILTPNEAERLLVAANRHPELEMLGAVTLALFCGIRTEELKRLSWESVKISESPPMVPCAASAIYPVPACS